MKILIFGLGVLCGGVLIIANEIGKYIDDIRPYDYENFTKWDNGEDFEVMNDERKDV